MQIIEVTKTVLPAGWAHRCCEPDVPAAAAIRAAGIRRWWGPADLCIFSSVAFYTCLNNRLRCSGSAVALQPFAWQTRRLCKNKTLSDLQFRLKTITGSLYDNSEKQLHCRYKGSLYFTKFPIRYPLFIFYCYSPHFLRALFYAVCRHQTDHLKTNPPPQIWAEITTAAQPAHFSISRLA